MNEEMKELKERNDLIRHLYKKGMGGIIGKHYGNISRQRVWQIVHKKKLGLWRRLWYALIVGKK